MDEMQNVQNVTPATENEAAAVAETTMSSDDVYYADTDTSVTSVLDDKAPILSPAFLGAPTAPTPPTSNNSTRLATTAFVYNVRGVATVNSLFPDENGNVQLAAGDVNAAAASHTHAGYATTTHNHDEDYAGIGHTHAEYATTSYLNGQIANHTHSGYAAASHSHSEYAESAHNHDEDYAALNHSHTGFAAENHMHTDYAAATHNHDADYADIDHTHTGFAASGHTHTAADVGAAAASHTHTDYAAAAHNHDADYADIDHTHTASAVGAAAANHTHTAASIGAAAASHTHTNYAATTHDHDEDYAALSHTHSTYAASGHTHTAADVGAAAASHTHTVDSALSSTSTNPVQNKVINTALAGKAAATHTHDYAASSHTHTPASIGAAAASHTHSYAASNHTHTAADVGALSTDGGTVNGDTNIAGILRVNGQQSFYFQTSTMSQTVGTNNATGGTTICCGADATVAVNGALLKTPTVIPKTTNTYYCGNANYRWKGIYSSAAVNVSSDERMKRDIAELDAQALAGFVDGLNVVSYNYKDDEADRKARIGLIAQQVQKVNPDLAKFFVHEDENGMLNLTPADLVFPLIAAVQQLSARVAELEANK